MAKQENWLPAGKKAALCFSIDDVHPGRSTDRYEAGGDLANGKLGLIEWLLRRHPALKVTLFVAADWRMIYPFPTRKLLKAIPVLRDRVYLTRVLKEGTMRLDRHPEFTAYLNSLPNTEVAFHGLNHIHKGAQVNMEFQEQSAEEFLALLREARTIFERAAIPVHNGICPPNWHAPEPLLEALAADGFRYLHSARDLFTEISPDAVNRMSGMKGVSLIYPQFIHHGKLVHIPANFNATRTIDRALRIIECNGIVSIKAHIVKDLAGYTLYDGIDEVYVNYLDTLLTVLENRFGEDLWFASMSEIAESMFETK